MWNRKEKPSQNKAIISLEVCGLSQREIAQIIYKAKTKKELERDRANIKTLATRNRAKYLPEIMNSIANYMTKNNKKVLKKPTNKNK